MQGTPGPQRQTAGDIWSRPTLPWAAWRWPRHVWHLVQGSTASARAELGKAWRSSDASRQPESWRIEALILLARADLQDRQLDTALGKAQVAVDLSREVFKDFPKATVAATLPRARPRVPGSRREATREALAQALSQFEVAMGPDSVAVQEVRVLTAGL
jgi:hypothetical protein